MNSDIEKQLLDKTLTNIKYFKTETNFISYSLIIKFLSLLVNKNKNVVSGDAVVPFCQLFYYY